MTATSETCSRDDEFDPVLNACAATAAYLRLAYLRDDSTFAWPTWDVVADNVNPCDWRGVAMHLTMFGAQDLIAQLGYDLAVGEAQQHVDRLLDRADHHTRRGDLPS
jgi:hypothetical protein